MRLSAASLVVVAACASTTTTATSTSTGTTTATKTTNTTPGSTATPTGGDVYIGEIVAPKDFDPKIVIDGQKPDFIRCFNQARASNPTLHGKLTLRIQLTDAGAVQSVDSQPGGSADDPMLVVCIGDVMKNVTFPKPGGTATIIAPLMFKQ